MSENIRTVDLTDNTIITDRDVAVNVVVNSIDVNQTDGTYAAVEPFASDGSYNGRVVIYPQSPVPQVTTATILKTFDRYGSLYYPLDAKFDYLRRKIWIADTGNNRVLKVDLNTNQADMAIDEDIFYPHALAVDFNTGDIWIKGYESSNLRNGAIFQYKKNGTLLATFVFNRNSMDASSSSSSEIGTMSSSSLSGSLIPPTMPSSRSIAFDHVRSRLWWVDGTRIYMLDVRNKQIQTYDVPSITFTEAINIVIEFETGNALVRVVNIHDDRFLVQINRDCNTLLGIAYIQG